MRARVRFVRCERKNQLNSGRMGVHERDGERNTRVSRIPVRKCVGIKKVAAAAGQLFVNGRSACTVYYAAFQFTGLAGGRTYVRKAAMGVRRKGLRVACVAIVGEVEGEPRPLSFCVSSRVRCRVSFLFARTVSFLRDEFHRTRVFYKSI